MEPSTSCLPCPHRKHKESPQTIGDPGLSPQAPHFINLWSSPSEREVFFAEKVGRCLQLPLTTSLGLGELGLHNQIGQDVES